MTEYDLRLKVANMAMSYVGAKEIDGSFKPIIDIYNQIKPLPRGYRMAYNDPWCAAFVSVIASLCGLLPIMPAECACDIMIGKYKALGRWIEDDNYPAKVGDVVFYDWDDSGNGDNVGSSDHVGIITKVDGNTYFVTEGNMSDSVGTRKISRNQKFIRGFGVPDYASMADIADDYMVVITEDEKTAPTDSDTIIVDFPVYDVHLPLCKKGDSGDVVKAAQILLIGWGFYCGPYGVDGDFGEGTLAGVKNFQRSKGLDDDGEIGGYTWAKLLGMKVP